MYKPFEKFSEYSSHQLLKCGGCIAIPHLHYSALKSAKYCREGHLADILWSYVHLLISFSHIQFGSEFSSHYIMMYCILIWERCYIFPCILILLWQIEYSCNVLFFFGIHSIGVTCFVAAGTHHPTVVYHSIFQVSSEQNTSGYLGSLCLSCSDSLIKGISCDTSQISGNFNGSGSNNSLYFSAISSHSWGISECVYLLSSFFKPTDFWVRQFTLSFLSLLLGCDFLDSQLQSSQGIFGSSCFNAFIETFFIIFLWVPLPHFIFVCLVVNDLVFYFKTIVYKVNHYFMFS